MPRSAAVAELEAQTPWTRKAFRVHGLSRLAASTATAARAFADDARTLTRLARQVPRCPGDETGGTPWTSFRREVAVACSVSDSAAGRQIRTALRLTSVLPHTLELLPGRADHRRSGAGVRRRARALRRRGRSAARLRPGRRRRAVGDVADQGRRAQGRARPRPRRRSRALRPADRRSQRRAVAAAGRSGERGGHRTGRPADALARHPRRSCAGPARSRRSPQPRRSALRPGGEHLPLRRARPCGP